MAVERIDQILLEWKQTIETRMIEQLVIHLVEGEPQRELLDALLRFNGTAALTRLVERVLKMQDATVRHRLIGDLTRLAGYDSAAAGQAMRKLAEDAENPSRDSATRVEAVELPLQVVG